MGYHHSAEHANFRPCDVSLTQKFSICDQLWISSQHIFYIYIVSLQVFKPFLTIHIKMIHTQSLSPTASLHYHMFLRHYLTLISTAAHFTLASPTNISGQITWSMADGRQMDPFPGNWLMVSLLNGGFCLYVVLTRERVLFLTPKLKWSNRQPIWRKGSY